jgi:hypothetical protein
MALTTEQIRQKYGITPQAPNAKATQDRLSAFKAKYGTKEKTGTQAIIPDIKKILGTEGERFANVATAVEQAKAGEKSYPTAAAQVLGQGAGALGDILFTGAKRAAETLMSKEAYENISKAPEKLMASPVGKALGGVISPVAKKIEREALLHPELAGLTEAGLNIASVLPAPKAVSGAITGAKEAKIIGKDFAKTAVQGAKQTGKGISKIAEPAITRGRVAITPMETNVKNVLKAVTPERVPEVEGKIESLFTQARRAKDITGEATPYDVVGRHNFSTALDTMKGKLTQAGEAKDKVLQQFGSEIVPNVNETRSLFDKLLKDRLGVVTKDGKFENAFGRFNILSKDPVSIDLAGKVDTILKELEPQKVLSAGGERLSDRATLQKINDAIDAIQAELYATKQVGAKPINTKLEGAIKEVIGDLNEKAKLTADKFGTGYRVANEEFSRIKTIFDKLNKIAGGDYKNAGSIIKRIFSPQDGGIKKLLKEVQQETGLNIFEDATLAKLAMEAVNDPRARTLLKGGLSKAGIIQRVLEYTGEKALAPKEKALKILRKGK